ncbi:cysteine hydrolase family protein [Paenibacillus harenae]|uniref:cysteine hydrolase family protein n=1 Tax=Paenibacillus harenae TaxID=306543 RepID=UPI000406BCDA|nr:isochorismatase family protein [Paenibacillus harenae]
MKIGLLIVDMQQSFIDEGFDMQQVEEACVYINHVSGLLRAAEQTVIHIQDMEGANGDEDRDARSIIPQVTIGPNDLRVEKEYSNAFWKTDLERILREQGVEFVVICGLAAEHCITFTANGATERGFKAAILQKGILSMKPDAISAVYRDRQVVSYSVIEFMAKMMKAGKS